MSFLNSFIEWSILSEEINQTAELNYHTELLQTQNDNLNSLIEHQQEQDRIRDYIYRINKACEQLEKNKNKDSLDFYYAIYCLAKGINKSGLSTSAISEIKDKEYFDACLNRISKLMFDVKNRNHSHISELNEHIQNIETESIYNGLKRSEDSRYEILKINQKIESYEKERNKKFLRSFIGFLPFGAISVLGLYEKIQNDYSFLKNMDENSYLSVCVILFIVALLVGDFVGERWTKKKISKQKSPLSKDEYDSYINKKAELNKKKSEDSSLYEYASSQFPELDFSEENYKNNAELIRLELSKKEKLYERSLGLLQSSPDEISKEFFIYE